MHGIVEQVKMLLFFLTKPHSMVSTARYHNPVAPNTFTPYSGPFQVARLELYRNLESKR